MQVARALALKFDLGCFEGSGTPPEIRGLKNVVGITLDATLAAAPANLDVFANAMTDAGHEQREGHRHRDASANVRHAGENEARDRATTTCRCCWRRPARAVARSIYGVPVYSQLAVVHHRRHRGKLARMSSTPAGHRGVPAGHEHRAGPQRGCSTPTRSRAAGDSARGSDRAESAGGRAHLEVHRVSAEARDDGLTVRIVPARRRSRL